MELCTRAVRKGSRPEYAQCPSHSAQQSRQGNGNEGGERERERQQRKPRMGGCTRQRQLATHQPRLK
eukprot:5623628-Prorocentrum_lima.AAC.1